MTDAMNLIMILVVVVVVVVVVAVAAVAVAVRAAAAELKCLNRGGVGPSWRDYLCKSVSSSLVPECTFSRR